MQIIEKQRCEVLTCAADCTTSFSEPPTHVVRRVMQPIFLSTTWARFGEYISHLKKEYNFRFLIRIKRRETFMHDVKLVVVCRGNDLHDGFLFWGGVKEVQTGRSHLSWRVVSAQMRWMWGLIWKSSDWLKKTNTKLGVQFDFRCAFDPDLVLFVTDLTGEVTHVCAVVK